LVDLPALWAQTQTKSPLATPTKKNTPHSVKLTANALKMHVLSFVQMKGLPFGALGLFSRFSDLEDDDLGKRLQETMHNGC